MECDSQELGQPVERKKKKISATATSTTSNSSSSRGSSRLNACPKAVRSLEEGKKSVGSEVEMFIVRNTE